jgi:DNA-binding MarR family transcriptional regulator
MWRDVDPREAVRDRSEDGRGRSGGSPEVAEGGTAEPRDAVMRQLDLPRGSTRERVPFEAREYHLSEGDVRVLASAGAFRIVPANAVRAPDRRTPTRPARHVERLRDQGLVNTVPYIVGHRRTHLVTLTERGRTLLESRRRDVSTEPRQAFYAGLRKPRELAHDARVYEAYLRAADRLSERGGRVRRVVLEEELKADYQRFLQRGNRGRRNSSGQPERDQATIERWAREHHLHYEDGHVDIPDLRIEYDDRDGREMVEDVEVVTPHYRGAHAAAKARAGFSRYRAVGARVGGMGGTGRSGRQVDPRAAEELLP